MRAAAETPEELVEMLEGGIVATGEVKGMLEMRIVKLVGVVLWEMTDAGVMRSAG